MKELEDSLKYIDWSCPQKSFTSIAQILMGKYIIKKGTERYRIVEIEFYAFSNDHEDYITYPRTTNAGQWFFHQSGVDLTFESQDIDIKHNNGKILVNLASQPQFGGILIRGLYKMDTSEDEEPYIFGPQKCVNVLWDKFNALSSSPDEYPTIIRASREDNLTTHNLIYCKRCINIKDENTSLKIKGWIKRLNLCNRVSPEEIENYRKKMFNNENTQLYRYFNLPSGTDPCSFTQIPFPSRPKKIRLI